MLISFLYMRVCRYECVPLPTLFCILNLRDKNNKSSSRSKLLHLRWKRIMQKNMEMCRRHDKTFLHQRKMISISRGKRVQYWSSLWHYILTRIITSKYLYRNGIPCYVYINIGRAFLRSKFFNLFDLIKFLQKYIMCRKSKRIWEGEKHPLFLWSFSTKCT